MLLAKPEWVHTVENNEQVHILKVGDIVTGKATVNYSDKPEDKPYNFTYLIDLGFTPEEKTIQGWGLQDLAKQVDLTIREFIAKLI